MNKQIEIRSIEQAEKMVESISDPREQETLLYQCVDSILNEENTEIAGSEDSFHNFSVTCLKVAEDYLTAFKIVELGLKLYPSDTDLLGDAIRYGYKCGKRDRCEQYIKILNDIGNTRWSWRAFSFSIDYYLERYVSDVDTVNKKLLENKLLTLVAQYQERYPDDQDSYFSEYEIYNRLGRKEEAFSALEKTLDKDTEFPKCWLKYADKLVDFGRFSEAVKPIMKLCNASRASDSVNISYVYYLKGICQMELLTDSSEVNEEDIFFSPEYDPKKVEQTYRSFYNSLISEDIYGSLKKKCWARIQELSIKTETEYPYYIDRIAD